MVALEVVLKIAKDNSPLARELAQRLADTILDWAEEKAAQTATTLDDRWLAWVRTTLAIPEFDEPAAAGSTGAAPEPGLPAGPEVP